MSPRLFHIVRLHSQRNEATHIESFAPIIGTKDQKHISSLLLLTLNQTIHFGGARRSSRRLDFLELADHANDHVLGAVGAYVARVRARVIVVSRNIGR